MQPLTELTEGLKVLEPFLELHGFLFDHYETSQASGGQFTVATFKSGGKRLIIGYRYSVGELAYQFNDYLVGHSFYLDHLGFADQKRFPDFQSDDKLLAFRHILHDFAFLTDDFFNGSCVKLIDASKEQSKFVQEHNRKAQEEYNDSFDKLTIDRARQKFKEKDYSGSLAIYMTVKREDLLNEFDIKAIEYCRRHL